MRYELPLDEIAEVCRRNRVVRLELFGSASGNGDSRSEFGPQSDFDMLVEFEPDTDVGFLTLARVARELSVAIGRPVDLVPRSGLKPLIRDQVLNQAEVLFAA